MHDERAELPAGLEQEEATGSRMASDLAKQGGQTKGLVIRVVESGPRIRAGAQKSPITVQVQSPRDVPLPMSPITPPASAYISPQSPPADFGSTTSPPPYLPSPGPSSPPPAPPPHAQTQQAAAPSIARKPTRTDSLPAVSPTLSPPVPSSIYRQPGPAGPQAGPRSRQVSAGTISTVDSRLSTESDAQSQSERPAELRSELQYHHRNVSEGGTPDRGKASPKPGLTSAPRDPSTLSTRQHQLRPYSSYSSLDHETRERPRTGGLSPLSYGRGSSQGRRSPDARRSHVDLLNVPYPQPAPPALPVDNTHLRAAVGTSAALLSSQTTLDMYRANVKKTGDLSTQYSFAIFLLETAQSEAARPSALSADAANEPAKLVDEARQILVRLADKSYPFAQYYLADGYASGAFNRGKSDQDRAYPLFVAATKHGHAEAGYRAALCLEFGWGTRRDAVKAQGFYRQSAARNHPGAMARLGRALLGGELGLGGAAPGSTDAQNRYREGLKWLKRAAEAADPQHNAAPYELGALHETGHGPDVFRDETYAAQLFTQSADLGHPEANYRLGDAYEHGTLGCPKDPALSVHFYNGAASRGHARAQMALCAWFMVGAPPVLERDENEAYEWAKRAAELGQADPFFPPLPPLSRPIFERVRRMRLVADEV